MKPAITGRDNRFSSQPARSRPSTSWISPDSSASTTASAMNSGVSGCASDSRLAPESSEVSATGPVDSAPQEPNKAPTNAGSKAA